MSSDKKPVVSTNEEDDLDGLDDVLDEFTSKNQDDTKPSSTPAAAATTNSNLQSSSTSTSTSDSKPTSSSAPTATTNEDALGDFDEEEFARELEANMAALMKTFGGADGIPGHNSSSAAPGSAPQQGSTDANGMSEEDLMKQFEAMMSEMGLGSEAAGLGGLGGTETSQSKSKPSNSNTNTNPTPANYQDALKATMSRLKQSDASASASASGGNNLGGLAGMFPGLENDEEMKKLFETLGAGADGTEGENPEFSKMLENMMGELMGKEVLYQPMKELADKYQPFLNSPPRELSIDDKTRYEKQAKIVKEVVALFENPKFDNGTEAERQKLKEEVGEKMNEMQECGAPPDEVAGEMPEGMDGIPGLDGNPENCTVM